MTTTLQTLPPRAIYDMTNHNDNECDFEVITNEIPTTEDVMVSIHRMEDMILDLHNLLMQERMERMKR